MEKLNWESDIWTTKLWNIVDFSRVKNLFKAGITATLVAWAWTALAQDTSHFVSYNNWCDEKPTLCSSIKTNDVFDAWYDKKTNTFTIPASNQVIVWWPIIMPIVDEKNVSIFKSNFDLDTSWDISISDIEKKFGINLIEFHSLYKGETLFFEFNSEISSMYTDYNMLMEKKSIITDEQEMKKVDKEIFSLLKEIERKKTKLYIEYFESLQTKINWILSNDAQKIIFLSYLDTSDETIKSFHNYVVSNISQSASDEINKYQESSYVDTDIVEKLSKIESDVNISQFSKEELSKYSLEFIRLKDINNMKILSSWLHIDNLFEFLSDINNDGSINNSDKWILYWGQLLSLLNDIEKQMILEWKKDIFYSHLTYIFKSGGFEKEIKNKQDLFTLLKADPLSKRKFIDWINFLNLAWVDIAYVLKYWKDWVQIWNNSKEKLYNHPLIWKFIAKMKDKILNTKSELINIKSKGIITDKEYEQMIFNLEKTISKPWFDEQLFNQVVWMLSSLSGTYLSESSNLNGTKFSYSKNIFNPQNEKFIKKFIDKLELDLWLINTSAWNMLMLWLAYKVDHNLSQTDKLSYWFWAHFGVWSVSNVLPVLSLWYTKVTNLDEIKSAWIPNFDLTKNSFTISSNYSMLNVQWMNLWLFVWYKVDKQSALEEKYSEYSALLDTLFEYDVHLSLDQYWKWLEKKVNDEKFEKVNFIANSTSNIVNILEFNNFNSLSIWEKKTHIQIIKMQLLSKFLWYYATAEEEKWYWVSGFWLSFNLLLKIASWGFPLLPWIEFSKMTYDYDIDPSKKTVWEISKQYHDWESIDFSQDQSKFLSHLDTYINIKWLDIRYEDWLLKMSSNSEENIFDFLQKSWVYIFVNPSEKTTHQIWFDWKNIIFWDIKKLSTYIDTGKDGKKVVLVLWWEWVWNKIKLTSDTISVLTNNFPSKINEIKYNQRNISLQNIWNVTTKKIWIFM